MLCLNALTMESDPRGGIEPENNSLESSIQGRVVASQGAFDGQIIMLQPPSSAAKVIAILCIIWASFGIIGSLLGFITLPSLADSGSEIYIPEFEWYKEVAYVNIFSELVFTVVLLAGAIMLLKKKKLGVYVILGSVGFGLLRDLVMNTTYPEFASAAGGIDSTLLSVLSIFCSVLCGLLAAIPLMIQNNGLE